LKRRGVIGGKKCKGYEKAAGGKNEPGASGALEGKGVESPSQIKGF